MQPLPPGILRKGSRSSSPVVCGGNGKGDKGGGDQRASKLFLQAGEKAFDPELKKAFISAADTMVQKAHAAVSVESQVEPFTRADCAVKNTEHLHDQHFVDVGETFGHDGQIKNFLRQADDYQKAILDRMAKNRRANDSTAVNLSESKSKAQREAAKSRGKASAASGAAAARRRQGALRTYAEEALEGVDECASRLCSNITCLTDNARQFMAASPLAGGDDAARFLKEVGAAIRPPANAEGICSQTRACYAMFAYIAMSPLAASLARAAGAVGGVAWKPRAGLVMKLWFAAAPGPRKPGRASGWMSSRPWATRVPALSRWEFTPLRGKIEPALARPLQTPLVARHRARKNSMGGQGYGRDIYAGEACRRVVDEDAARALRVEFGHGLLDILELYGAAPWLQLARAAVRSSLVRGVLKVEGELSKLGFELAGESAIVLSSPNGARALAKEVKPNALPVKVAMQVAHIGAGLGCGGQSGVVGADKLLNVRVGAELDMVFMYYWDERDGPEFSGWWFGDALGGSQVWARAPSTGQTPPRTGWKIPWDAPRAEPGLLFVTAFEAASSSARRDSHSSGRSPGAPAPSLTPGAAPGARELQQKSAEATARVEEAEQAAQEALRAAKALKGDEVPAETLREVKTTLEERMAGIQEAQRFLTARIGEVRQGGLAATPVTTEMSKLSPRLMKLRPVFTMELARIKKLLETASSTAAHEAATAKQKALEERDSKDLQDALPACNDLVNAAEDTTESLGILAKPLMDDLPDDEGELLNDSIVEIETAAAEASSKISEARKYINQKLQDARRFAPETRKLALAEFAALQQKITDAKTKLEPYKSFRRELEERVAAKKALREITDKLAVVELEAEKSVGMVSAASQGQMSEDEVSSAEKVATPAGKGVSEISRMVEAKLKGLAEGPMKEELSAIRGKIGGIRKQLDEVSAVLKRQHEGLEAQKVVSLAREKVERAEETLQLMADAEVPFLKGIEVLPPQESKKALGECETAAAKAESSTHSALSFLKQKADSKRYSKDVQKTFATDLAALQKRADEAKRKVDTFKKETSQRRTASIMSEVTDKVTAAEEAVKALCVAGEIFSKDDLSEVSVEALREASEACAEKEKEASSACVEARKIISVKQREAKSGSDAAAMVSKLQGRLNAAQQDLAKTRRAASSGEKLAKGKEILGQEEYRPSVYGQKSPGNEGAMAVDEGQQRPDSHADARKQLGVNTEQLLEVDNLGGEEFEELREKLRGKQASLCMQIAKGKSLDTRLREMSLQRSKLLRKRERLTEVVEESRAAVVEAQKAVDDAVRALETTANDIVDLETERCQLVAGAPHAPQPPGGPHGGANGTSLQQAVLEGFGGSADFARRLHECLHEAKAAEEAQSAERRRLAAEKASQQHHASQQEAERTARETAEAQAKSDEDQQWQQRERVFQVAATDHPDLLRDFLRSANAYNQLAEMLETQQGTSTDCFVMSEGVAIRAGKMDPRSVPALAPVACARFPGSRTSFHRQQGSATTQMQLPRCWGVVIEGIEIELLDRRDRAGPRRAARSGRAEERQVRRQKLMSAPRQRQPRPPRELAARGCSGQSKHVPNLPADVDEQPRRPRLVAKALLDTEAFLVMMRRLDWAGVHFDSLLRWVRIL
ncbi:unnamed protein product [Prorocentrum cordatum]|uniref:Uncharacterized protein n=1 Tax=Prorocentrum cordatum TaxID=2364126 RepID=A0ABN9SG66_9DINO|nr:unnamed protein product [Polarella glacialis]